MSGADCNGMNQADWDCLTKSGYSFAIIQAWEGGYQYTSHIGIFKTSFIFLTKSKATCVSQSRTAGMAHTDVYAFMCPQCSGNGSPTGAVETIVNNLHNQGVSYGMLWFGTYFCYYYSNKALLFFNNFLCTRY